MIADLNFTAACLSCFVCTKDLHLMCNLKIFCLVFLNFYNLFCVQLKLLLHKSGI